jgi:2-phosphosulfolactate phosphatase
LDPFTQEGFRARLEWGEAGLRRLAPSVEALVIVDVLSFSTAVEVATARGASVHPYAFHDSSAADFARSRGAMLAVSRYDVSPQQPYSLSPETLATIPPGSRLVLPSPNGSTLTVVAADTGCAVAAGCLRNSRAVARWAADRTLGVIAAGELSRAGGLRFAIEDLIGAGAILRHVPVECRSPEAEVAVAAFERFAPDLHIALAECASGRELAAIGFSKDVSLAAELDVSDTVPIFQGPGLYAA